MPEPLPAALDSLRATLLDAEQLVRAVAAGRRRGQQPDVRRAELRPVDLKSGRHLQIVTSDGRQATTTNHPVFDGSAAAAAAVDALLAQPFGNWYVESLEEVVQLRVTKKGDAQVHRAKTSRRDVRPAERLAEFPVERVAAAHDRVKQRLIDPADPLFAVLGADADKRRQVDAFLRLLAPVVDWAASPAQGRRPVHVVDLGCGNAYLTFAAHRYLTDRLGDGSVRTVGVDRSPHMIERNATLAADAGLDGLSFEVGDIVDAEPFAASEPFVASGQDTSSLPQGTVDLVLALHACDTATDDALARAVRWQAAVTLAAPCCHHDIQRQLAGARPPEPYAALTRHGILRERFADVLTDALRALLLRVLGHRVDVVEFVDSRHTPRNALLRVVRTGAAATTAQLEEYDALVQQWGVHPALAAAVVPELTRTRGQPPRPVESADAAD